MQDHDAALQHNHSLIPWHSMFMGVALLAASRSKDHRKRNGACIASVDNKIVGVGYNGLPRGCNDQDPAYWADNDADPFQSRHSYIVHAEVNAILNCVVLPLTGSTIYTTQFPCPRCAQSIIQVGIAQVVYLEKKSHQVALNSASDKMLSDAGVRVLSLEQLESPSAQWCGKLDEFIRATGPVMHRGGT
ncbi:deoxycytidylate deaminase [Roseateles sp.]|jgi:dCMP deaminase|uniref:deoxycytidylate deaminase n=1 Tax=Roseateles sp. TaxID=1971397 RepID=UPI003919838B